MTLHLPSLTKKKEPKKEGRMSREHTKSKLPSLLRGKSKGHMKREHLRHQKSELTKDTSAYKESHKSNELKRKMSKKNKIHIAS